MYKNALILLALVGNSLLVACASVSYEEPVSGPMAKVRFATKDNFLINGLYKNDALFVDIYNYDSTNCEIEDKWFTLAPGNMYFSAE